MTRCTFCFNPCRSKSSSFFSCQRRWKGTTRSNWTALTATATRVSLVCAWPSFVPFRGQYFLIVETSWSIFTAELDRMDAEVFFLLLFFPALVLKCPLCLLYSLRAAPCLILGHWCVLCMETWLRRRCDVCPLGVTSTAFTNQPHRLNGSTVPSRWIILLSRHVLLWKRCPVNWFSAMKLWQINFKFKKENMTGSGQKWSNRCS